MRKLLDRAARDEKGGVLVTVAVALPILVLVAVFVVDVGNWFLHKRHLQAQADSGALAAAQQINFNGASGACSSGTGTSSYATYAHKYGQDDNTLTLGFTNKQLGGTPDGNVHFLFGSQTYFNQSSPVDSTAVAGDPCVSGMIDVKLTETDLPFIFGGSVVPHINAHSRVEFRKVVTAAHAAPIAVRTNQIVAGQQTILKLVGSGSQTQALDCDPTNTGANFRDQLSAGCSSSFTIDTANPVLQSDCTGFNFSTQPQPWKCTNIKTGNARGQVTQGVNLRVMGDASPPNGSCAVPNTYPNTALSPKRIVEVFITPFDFNSSGQTTIPITGFAAFYLTGWDGDPCPGDPNPGNGGIEGYFIRFIDTLGTGGTTRCNLSDTTSLDVCVPVLTQ